MKINAVIENKDGGTLVLDFPRSIYDVYEKIQSVGIRKSPHQITLSDEEGNDVRVKLYSEDEVGKHLLLTLNEQNTLADANLLAFIDDIVSYHNLTPGKEYVVKGTLMNKATGKPVTVNDEPVTAEAAFTPESRDGEVKVSFTFNSYVITETTDVVVFESLYREDVEIAVHADIEDEGQSVKVYVPEIKTTASIDGKKEITTAGKVTIEDVVSYTNLIPGTEYTIRGTLMNKATGEVFTVNGETITAEVKFTPENRNGEVKVTFTFDAHDLTTSTKVVVFEGLYREDVEITTHKDIEDKDQTVTITPPPDVPQTGDNSNLGVWIGLGGVALGGAIACVIMYFKKKKDDGEK